MELLPPRSHRGGPRKGLGLGSPGTPGAAGAGCPGCVDRGRRGRRCALRGAAPGQARPDPAASGRRRRRPQLRARAGAALRKASGPAGSRPARTSAGQGGRARSDSSDTARATGPPRSTPRGPVPSPGRRSPGPTWTLRQADKPSGQSRPLPPRARLRRGSDSAMGSPRAAGTLADAPNWSAELHCAGAASPPLEFERRSGQHCDVRGSALCCQPMRTEFSRVEAGLPGPRPSDCGAPFPSTWDRP